MSYKVTIQKVNNDTGQIRLETLNKDGLRDAGYFCPCNESLFFVLSEFMKEIETTGVHYKTICNHRQNQETTKPQ